MMMRHACRTVLLTLLSCCCALSAAAAGPAADQAPQPAAPPAVSAPLPKPAEAAPAQSATRLGHVDLVRVAAESETAKAGQAQFVELKKKLQGQLEAKRKQLDKQKSAIEARLKSYTAEQREAKAREFQKKVEEFQKFGQNAEKELQAKQEEFSEKLFKAIEQASSELGKAKGLALVVIKRELLFLNSGVDAQDVTDDVIKRIDKK